MTAKKKNPLKDLDAFLKQEASSLVTPEKISEEATAPAEEKPTKKRSTPKKTAKPTTAKAEPQKAPEPEVSKETILQMFQALKTKLGKDFEKEFYEIVLKMAESIEDDDPKKKIFINTMLYMQEGEDWKTAVRSYWEGQALN